MTTRYTRKRNLVLRWTAIGLVIGAALATIVSNAPGSKPEPGDFYGDPVHLDPAPTNAAAHFDQRIGCRIGAFGAAPWLPTGKPKGSEWERATRAALRSMSLPDEAVDIAIRRLRSPEIDGAIGFSNLDGLPVTRGPVYLPNFTTTYRTGNRYTVCHDSMTRFANDERREYAVVHRITVGTTTYHVGEFLACGNVSRFYPAPAGWTPRPRQQVAQPMAAAGQIVPIPLAPPQARSIASNQVDEPGTLTLALSALGVVLGGVAVRAKGST